WPTGSLEDLMTMALLEEKVEFVKLFAVNGLVTDEYLTVCNLRHLYNASCDPNSHLAKLLQRTTRSKAFHLKHVHKLLLALLGHHSDDAYLADTPDAVMQNSTINYYKFEDPYLELFLWSVLSGRGLLARYLWERCNSPLATAVVGSALYRALWKSLGAKNTELRNRYHDHCVDFEKLAVRLIEGCYTEDPVNAMGLVERRNAKWGNLDVLDLAFNGTEMNFIASSCCQASVDLSWRRGMVRCSTLPSLITIFIPFLVWTRLFSFQKLGDNGGELTKFQKLIVFYKSPMTKFYSHSLSFVLFLTLHAYVVLFDFQFQMSLSEKILLLWVITFALEEISELSHQQPTTFYAKLMIWFDSVWNRFDIVAFIFASVAFGLRMNRTTFTYGRIAYAFNTAIFFCRVLRIYHVHFRLGPKLVIFYRMLSEVLMFMALLIVFILGYGLSAQSLLHPSPSRTLESESIMTTIKDVILIPYWQMYGELLLENMEGQDKEVCHFAGVNETMFCENPKDYTWAVQIMLIFYLIIGNIMLLNLLIAIFT
ncbi:Ion transport domain, partial [Trinorchestia longiramus]